MGRHQKDYFEYGGFYHVYNKVVTGRKLFETGDDYDDFLQRYIKYLSPYLETYAYCLIPNHYHFLVKVKGVEDIDVSKENTIAAQKYLKSEESINFFLENQLSRMFSGIAIKYNNRSDYNGSLFKEGTKRVQLKTESRVIYQMCYIHHNPIHHHLTNYYNEWKYSSYKSYLSDKNSLVKTNSMLNLIEGLDVFHQLHENFKLNRKEDVFGELD